MKNLILILISIYSLNGHAQTHKQIKLINETISKYKNHKSISYDILYSIKFFDADTPYVEKSSVYILENKQDTLFNYQFVYNFYNNNGFKYYSYPYLYFINKKTEVIERSDASKGHTKAIQRQFNEFILKVYFIEIENLNKKLNNSQNKIIYLDTANFLKITIKSPDNDDFKDYSESIYIDKTTKAISKITFQVRHQDQIQQNIWLLSNIVFDQLKQSDLEKRVEIYLNTFKIEDYKPLTKEDYKLLDEGATAPKTSGQIFPYYDKTIDLNIDKITILDFWYTSCMPCIKTVAILNQLKEKYKDKIEIIGVNPVEYKEIHKEKIDAFIARNFMNYPILLIEKIPEEYNIRAFPTIYILDKDSKVRFARIGHSEEQFEELDKVIDALINSEK